LLGCSFFESLFSDAGRGITLGVPLVIGGDNLPSPVGIGLTDLPIIGGASGPLAPQSRHHSYHNYNQLPAAKKDSKMSIPINAWPVLFCLGSSDLKKFHTTYFGTKYHCYFCSFVLQKGVIFRIRFLEIDHCGAYAV
jgi:hypothetical protein